MKKASSRKPSRKAPPKATSAPPHPAPLRFDQGKEVRAIARERVGVVKPAQVIPSHEDKKERRKPKHKPPAGTLPES